MEEQKAIYGIIGNPLKHSLSPILHNAAFKALAVPAEYRLFPLEEGQLESFFQELRNTDSSIFGLNVTVPYKETVIPYLDSLNPLAQQVGAVNTIVISEKRKLTGYNTDAPGFMAHLIELNFSVEGKNIAILGAGGSARAILSTLCIIPDRPRSIRIYNRTTARVNELIEDLKKRFDLDIVEAVISVDDLNLRECDLLINTTSVGMKRDDPCLVDEDLLHPGMLVYDLIYRPKETALLKLAKHAGALTANGLGMLFYQGVLSLEHWADTRIDDNVKIAMRQALERAAHYE